MNEAPKRRWFRYGLRTLLLLMALVGVILGYSVSRTARERRTVEAILARHGKVIYHDNSYGRVHAERTPYAWLRELVGLRWPGEVYLEGRSINDDVLQREVLSLRTVAMVGLLDVSVTNAGLAQLRPLESLTYVHCLRDGRNGPVLDVLNIDPTSVEFNQTPLEDAVDFLADFHDITIELDDEAAKNRSAPIRATISNQPLSAALEQILLPLNLGYVVESGKIVITSRNRAEEQQQQADAVRAALPQVKTLIIDPER